MDDRKSEDEQVRAEELRSYLGLEDTTDEDVRAIVKRCRDEVKRGMERTRFLGYEPHESTVEKFDDAWHAQPTRDKLAALGFHVRNENGEFVLRDHNENVLWDDAWSQSQPEDLTCTRSVGDLIVYMATMWNHGPDEPAIQAEADQRVITIAKRVVDEVSDVSTSLERAHELVGDARESIACWCEPDDIGTLNTIADALGFARSTLDDVAEAAESIYKGATVTERYDAIRAEHGGTLDEWRHDAQCADLEINRLNAKLAEQERQLEDGIGDLEDIDVDDDDNLVMHRPIAERHSAIQHFQALAEHVEQIKQLICDDGEVLLDAAHRLISERDSAVEGLQELTTELECKDDTIGVLRADLERVDADRVYCETLESECERYNIITAGLEAEVDSARDARNELRMLNADLEKSVEKLTAERTSLESAGIGLACSVQKLTAERDSALDLADETLKATSAKEVEKLTTDLETARDERNAAIVERDEAISSRDAARKVLDEWKFDIDIADKALTATCEREVELERKNAELVKAIEKVTAERDNSYAHKAELLKTIDALKSDKYKAGLDLAEASEATYAARKVLVESNRAFAELLDAQSKSINEAMHAVREALDEYNRAFSELTTAISLS